MRTGLIVAGIIIIVALAIFVSRDNTEPTPVEDVTTNTPSDTREPQAQELPPANQFDTISTEGSNPTLPPNENSANTDAIEPEPPVAEPEDTNIDTTTEPKALPPAPEPEPTVSMTTVTYTDSGFSPQSVTIGQGDTVQFVDNSSRGMWVGADNHPSHTLYPEKTANDCLGSAFDQCRKSSQGETWEFTFNSVGSWDYHNHVRASHGGTVVVN